MYDMIIIGAGIAGLTAAIYGKRAGKNLVVFEAASYGGKIIITSKVENYPGISKISGFEFATGVYNQAKELGAEIRIERVVRVEKQENFVVTTTKGSYEAKTVIVATGVKSRSLQLDKEKEWTGKGISYCATCDGAFFRGKEVAVVGGGDTAMEDAIYLSDICSKVYLIHRRDTFRAQEKYVEQIKQKENIELIMESIPKKLLGTERLEGLCIQNVKSKEERKLEISGLFVAVGQMPDNEVFQGLLSIDDTGYIIAKEDCKTNIDGIYVAGDCRTKKVRQLVTAASDGAVAALAACEKIVSR